MKWQGYGPGTGPLCPTPPAWYLPSFRANPNRDIRLSPKVTSKQGRGTVCCPREKPDGWRIKGSAFQELVDKEQNGN